MLMFSAGADTVAVIDTTFVPLGVAKPAGVVMTRFAAPAVNGWKVVDEKFVSPLKTTGLVTMVPTVVLELVTVTFTVSPLRTFCLDWKVNVVGSNVPTTRKTVLSGENVVVLKFPFESGRHQVHGCGAVGIARGGRGELSAAGIGQSLHGEGRNREAPLR
jgi:hypothetical protein